MLILFFRSSNSFRALQSLTDISLASKWRFHETKEFLGGNIEPWYRIAISKPHGIFVIYWDSFWGRFSPFVLYESKYTFCFNANFYLHASIISSFFPLSLFLPVGFSKPGKTFIFFAYKSLPRSTICLERRYKFFHSPILFPFSLAYYWYWWFCCWMVSSSALSHFICLPFSMAFPNQSA